MHRTTFYIRPLGDVDVWEVEGHVVEVKDKHTSTGRGLYVQDGGSFLHRLTGDWRAHRWESLTRAAEQLEGVADKVAAKAAELRKQAEESRAAPGHDSGGDMDATGRAQPAVAT